MSSSAWDWYFRPRAWERAGRGRIYRWLGIRPFKRYLPTSGDLVSRARGVRRVAGFGPDLRESLVRHQRFTRAYEGRHIFGAVLMLALSWLSIALQGKGSWPVLLAANLLINGYPIMLQRYNRVRLQAALAALDDRPVTRPLPRRTTPPSVRPASG